MQRLKLNKNVLILHLTVLIWGFTGVLGELISLSAAHLVWYRVLIAVLSLFVYFIIKGDSIHVTREKLIQFVFVGGVVGLHWVLFFYSIKVSTVSVTLVTLSSITLFTSILEPLINKKRISLADVLVGVVIIFGIYLIFKFEIQYILGIIFGLSAALCASLFSILNARMVKHTRATIITFYEMFGAFFWISLFMAITGEFNEGLWLQGVDWAYLLLLGIGCTAVAYVLAVAVMKELSAFTVALTTNMEPVYGIVLALLIFGRKETMSLGFYGGAVIVLAAVFLYPYVKTRLEGGKSELPQRKLH
ncbi:DMT family transporter [Sphingobacterium sp. UT-1RO-CII-1]|uniref:DMT family transporter n=1 Tax=Sphingobacterium sp. UT-1RO-CII-1 TaxID=2995225 RepID=UPI00227B931B|nr:DMT family transporter [Sphingobacterium sp. UT-1RO-CII-1]MCY4778221.1 DMT family transporter [Sphingobacterium sp. UT-1RO-CII-1]